MNPYAKEMAPEERETMTPTAFLFLVAYSQVLVTMMVVIKRTERGLLPRF